MAARSPYLKFNSSGDPIPQVGFGLWKVAPENAAELVYEVLSLNV